MIGLTGWYTSAVSAPSGATTKVRIDNLILATPTPDYDKEVLDPLHQRQKADQALAKAKQIVAEQLAAAKAAEQKQFERSEVQTAQTTAPIIQGDCSTWMAEAGITDTANAYWLILKESGCDPNNWNGKAQGLPWDINRACGIGQQLPCGKWAHQWNDPVGAMIDMQNYVMGRYGSWANARAFWETHHYY